jgi:hypothetical protein
MTVEEWLALAAADADRRGLPELRPMLEALATATQQLRDADFTDDATGHRSRAFMSADDPGRDDRESSRRR